MDSKNKLNKMLEFVDICIRSNSEPEAISIITNKINELIPFHAATIAIDSKANFSLSAKKQIFTNNVNKEWKEIYFQQDYFNQDPILTAVSNSTNVLDWKNIYAENNNISKDYRLLSKEYVGHCGLSILTKNNEGSTLLSLAMEEQSISSEHHKLLDYISPHIHEVFNRRGPLQRRALWAPNLSKREIEVLNWAKEGKSNWEISIILAISERTVKFHFSNLFIKLGGVNRAQVLAKAVNYGLIVI